MPNELTVIGIQPQRVERRMDLSPPVAEAIGRAVDLVAEEFK